MKQKIVSYWLQAEMVPVHKGGKDRKITQEMFLQPPLQLQSSAVFLAEQFIDIN